MALVKVFVFSVLSCIFAKACFDAIKNYLHPPTAFRISHIDAESFEAPSFSIMRMSISSGKDVSMESFESLMDSRAIIDYAVSDLDEIFYGESLEESIESRFISVIDSSPISNTSLFIAGTTFTAMNKTEIGIKNMVINNCQKLTWH